MRRTSSVREFVGGMREDVVEPREESMRVAIRTGRIPQRMSHRRIQSVTTTDTPSEHTNRDGEPRHRAFDDLLDTIRPPDVGSRLHDRALAVDGSELVVGAKSGTEGEGRGLGEVGGAVAAGAAVGDGCGGALLLHRANHRIVPSRFRVGAGAEAGEGAAAAVRGRRAGVGREEVQKEREEGEGRKDEENPRARARRLWPRPKETPEQRGPPRRAATLGRRRIARPAVLILSAAVQHRSARTDPTRYHPRTRTRKPYRCGRARPTIQF